MLYSPGGMSQKSKLPFKSEAVVRGGDIVAPDVDARPRQGAAAVLHHAADIVVPFGPKGLVARFGGPDGRNGASRKGRSAYQPMKTEFGPRHMDGERRPHA